MTVRATFTLALVALASSLAGFAVLTAPSHDARQEALDTRSLPKIAAAPGFTLTPQNGEQVGLADFRGKVTAVTFIFTRCSTTCPVLTPMMSLVQERLGSDFGTRIAFASITVDPEHDTPEILKLYAQANGADVPGWSFLTGAPPDIAELAQRYGVFAKGVDGDIEHSLLTSLVDRRGVLRVQYLGVRFDPDEFQRDLLSLARER